MEHGALVAAAQRVAYFGDVQLFSGPHMGKGLSVYWHEGNRQWLVDIPGYAGGVARADVLRRFAENALAQLEAGPPPSGTSELESTVYADDYASIDVATGFDDGLYFILWVWFDSKRDFIGVSKLGEALYGSRLGTSYLELYVEPADRQVLIGTLRTLLDRLVAVGQASYPPPQSANVITTFTKRTSDPKKTRLDIAHRAGDNQWLITLYPTLTRPASPEAIQALAEAARVAVQTRESQTTALLVESGYRMEVTIGPEADAFGVTAKVSSTTSNGTQHVLALDAHFGPVSEAHLTDMVTALSKLQ